MKTIALAVVAASLATLCPAQITVSMSAVTPINLSAGVGSVTTSQSVPAGPLGAWSGSSTLGAMSDAWASYNQTNYSTAYQAGASIQVHTRINSTAANTFASAGPAHFLLEFQSATNIPTRLELGFEADVSPGSPMPSIAVDVGNDGIVDFINGAPTTSASLDFTIGSQPLQVAILANAALQQQGTATAVLAIRMKPRNDVYIQEVTSGCFQAGGGIGAAPTFVGRGVDVFAGHIGNLPKVTVFGFQVQPHLLPSNASMVCLLVPAPDIVLAGFTHQTFHVPLPAAVRPANMWMQSVFLYQGQLLTTNALNMAAY